MATRAGSVRHVIAAGLVLGFLPRPALEAARIAPVAAVCPPDRPQRLIDQEGEHDRCLAREDAKCPAGAALRPDAKGEADVCEVAGSGDSGKATKTKAPSCRRDFRLHVRAGKDVCEKTGPPLCPSGALLKTGRGEDQCRY